jgi:hypothetical protein
LTAGHARTLLAFPVERRETMARRAIDEDLTVRALERLAHDGGDAKRTRAAATTTGRTGKRAPTTRFVEQLRYRFRDARAASIAQEQRRHDRTALCRPRRT